MGRLTGLFWDIRFRIWATTVLPTTVIFLVAALFLRSAVRAKIATLQFTGQISPEQVFDAAFAGRYIIVGTVVGLICSSVITFCFFQRGLRAFESVNRLAKEMARGNFQVRTRVRRCESDLAQDLGRNINALAESLEHTDRLRRDLVANLAHEIRTPLANLQGYLEALRDGVIEANTESLASVHEEVMRLVRLVDALHQLARADALRQRPLELSPTDLDSLAEQLALVARPHAASRGIKLYLDLAGNAPMVPVHADSIAQVMRNLLRNAVQYTEDGGTIRVQTHAGEGVYAFVCLNTGPGVPPEDLPLIFQRFYRTDKARQGVATGVGLGLAIAKELVEAHGGRIGAESKNGWTNIWFEVPMDPTRKLEGAP